VEPLSGDLTGSSESALIMLSFQRIGYGGVGPPGVTRSGGHMVR